MKLIKTSIFSGIITIIRISSGFIAGKIVAVLTGPAGVALVGQFTNFITIILTFSNGAINTGVVKYTAEFDEDDVQRRSLFSTAVRITIWCSLAIGLILLIFAEYISNLIFGALEYVNVIRVLSLTIGLYALNTLLISILNGLKQIRLFTLINTLGSILGLAVTVGLVYFFKISGALYGLVLSPSIVCLITIFILRKSPAFTFSDFAGKFDAKLASKLAHFSLMAIITALTMPVAQIVIRNYIISQLGLNEAGYWQGIMRISDGYLMLITTALSTYYLPKLSSLFEESEIKREIFDGFKIIIPLLIVSTSLIYLLRGFIIHILYSDSFLPMESLFFYQLVGDFFKMSAWILSYLMVAKAMTRVYILTEVIFSLSYVLFSFVLIPIVGIKGVVIGFALNYFIYFICMIFIFRKLLFKRH